MSEADTLARTLYGESRGEGLLGKVAVANVILNRVDRPRWWGATIEEVCLKPAQFSCWNEDDPNRRAIEAVSAKEPVFMECMTIAELAILGCLNDVTGGATHYHAYGIKPTWAQGKEPHIAIGRHVFYGGIA